MVKVLGARDMAKAELEMSYMPVEPAPKGSVWARRLTAALEGSRLG